MSVVVVMIKYIQFRPKPEMSIWLQQKADAGFRSVASIIQEILSEKMQQEVQGSIEKSNLAEEQSK